MEPLTAVKPCSVCDWHTKRAATEGARCYGGQEGTGPHTCLVRKHYDAAPSKGTRSGHFMRPGLPSLCSINRCLACLINGLWLHVRIELWILFNRIKRSTIAMVIRYVEDDPG